MSGTICHVDILESKKEFLMSSLLRIVLWSVTMMDYGLEVLLSTYLNY